MIVDLYTLTILCTIGAASSITFGDMQKEHNRGNFHAHLGGNQIGGGIGTLLSFATLIYAFIHFKWWHPLIIILASCIIVKIFSSILTRIVGLAYSRLIQIWILPILATIYFIIKIII